MILAALVITMLATLLWGFSTNLAIAVAARVITGLASGDVGIIRTTVAELVPEKELQPRAFSVMPMVWSVGSILGPSLGGVLANPYNVKPGEGHDSSNLLKRYPFALPNLVSAAFFLVGGLAGLLFLEETLETKRSRRDYGRVLGRQLLLLSKRAAQILRPREESTAHSKQGLSEREPLLGRRNSKDEETAAASTTSSKAKETAPSFREVLTLQASLNLLYFTILAAHCMAYDSLLPVYMQYPTLSDKSVHSVEGEVRASSGLHFAAGFGLPPRTIGLLLTCCGVLSIFVQFFVFPPTCRRYGPLRLLRVCSCIYPVIYLLTPLTALLSATNDSLTNLLPPQVWACFVLMLARCFVGTFAFPCCFILLTNSAISLKGLGTLNGLATSLPAIGRAAGPMFAGAIFSLGVQRGYMIAPWWLLAGLSLFGAVTTIFQVEGKGFARDAGSSETQDGQVGTAMENDEVLRAESLVGGAEAAGDLSSPVLGPSMQRRISEEDAFTTPELSRLPQRD